MKLLVVFSALFVVSAYGLGNVDLALNSLHSGRSKRDLSSMTEIFSISCIQRCVRPLRDPQLKTKLESINNAGMMKVSAKGMNKEEIDDMCRPYKRSRDCMDRCESRYGENKIVRLVRKAFRPVEMICETKYDALIRSLPCYNKIVPSIRNICIPKCRITTERLSALMKTMADAQKRADIPQLQQTLGKMCGIAECRLDCELKLMRTECESMEPSEVVEDILEMVYTSVGEIWKELGIYEMYPDECKRLEGSAEDETEHAEIMKEIESFETTLDDSEEEW